MSLSRSLSRSMSLSRSRSTCQETYYQTRMCNVPDFRMRSWSEAIRAIVDDMSMNPCEHHVSLVVWLETRARHGRMSFSPP
jgi:hypothetical protein